MKKKLIIIFTLFLTLFTLTGCFLKPRKAASADDFKSIASKHNLTVVDVYDQMKQYEVIKTALLARASDGWQIEFYILSTDDDAIDMYETNKTLFENSKEGKSREKYANIKNYSMYNLISGGKYMYLSRINNTLLYVKVDKKYEDNVKRIVKELGY